MSDPVDVQTRLPHETFKALSEIADLAGVKLEDGIKVFMATTILNGVK